jgi:hypothetical protein
MSRPKQSRGVRPDDGNGATYQLHTRNQSNGGRSLRAEHLALYQQELAAERDAQIQPNPEETPDARDPDLDR